MQEAWILARMSGCRGWGKECNSSPDADPGSHFANLSGAQKRLFSLRTNQQLTDDTLHCPQILAGIYCVLADAPVETEFSRGGREANRNTQAQVIHDNERQLSRFPVLKCGRDVVSGQSDTPAMLETRHDTSKVQTSQIRLFELPVRPSLVQTTKVLHFQQYDSPCCVWGVGWGVVFSVGGVWGVGG